MIGRKASGGPGFEQYFRNATLLAIAPNANIGLVAGTAPGIDPRFAQMFSRNKISGKYLEINPNLVAALQKENLWEKVREQILEHHGDISEIVEIPEHIKRIYKTSFSVSPYAFIEVAARAQKWVDMGISRNMYLDIRDIDEIMNIYTSAWDRGLKTTYYLHMKPRHTAEQSTTKVNKSEAMGRRGFGALRDKQSSNQIDTPAAVVAGLAIEEVQSPVISEITPLSPLPKGESISDVAQMPSKEAEEASHICLPEDPNDKFLCESCQ